MHSPTSVAPPVVVLRSKGHGMPTVTPCSQYSLTGQRMQESTLDAALGLGLCWCDAASSTRSLLCTARGSIEARARGFALFSTGQ
eukprot:7302426-Prymnesium_polylepis.1